MENQRDTSQTTDPRKAALDELARITQEELGGYEVTDNPLDRSKTADNLCAVNNDVVLRRQVMWLIEREIANWSDTDPPRHALSVLWGKIRDMDSADEIEQAQIDDDQYRSTVSA